MLEEKSEIRHEKVCNLTIQKFFSQNITFLYSLDKK